jgi:hypothetical protein
MTESNPEIGQLLFGQAPAYSAGMSDWVGSMFDGIMREFDRVWWNTKQKQYSSRSDDGSLGNVHVRCYRYDDVPEGEVGDDNFWLEGHEQRIRWYKYPGRGMSCKFDLDRDAWIAWHDAVMAELRCFDKEHFERHYKFDGEVNGR